jgi:hypothetical protein
MFVISVWKHLLGQVNLVKVSIKYFGCWTYNYLCNQCLSPLTFWVWIPPGRGLLNTTLWDHLNYYHIDSITLTYVLDYLLLLQLLWFLLCKIDIPEVSRFTVWTILLVRSSKVRCMLFNATFNNISVISWRSALYMDETRRKPIDLTIIGSLFVCNTLWLNLSDSVW